MKTPQIPNVDQLLVLLMVVETGSFTGAARRLGRATSAVSYAMDALEAKLGLRLFERDGVRRSRLTPAGEAIVAEARAVAHSVDLLRARAKGLLEGVEPEVSLVVDSFYPGDLLVEALGDFRLAFPTVPLRLNIQPLNGVDRAVRSGEADLAVGGVLHIDPAGMACSEIGSVPVIPVAAPGHPLAAPAPPSARQHVQIVLSDCRRGEADDHGVVGLTTWRVGDVGLKHQLLLAGLGWGGMPESMVRADVAAGRLVRLNLREYRGAGYPLQVVHATENPPGPAGRWLVERLAQSLALPQRPAG